MPEAGKWKPRPVLLLHVVLLVFQARVVARQQQEDHAHAALAQRVDAAPQCLLLYILYLKKYGMIPYVLYTVPTVYFVQVYRILPYVFPLKWCEA